MIEFLEITLGDKEYFKMFLGKRILKKDIYKSKKGIPVISANVFDSVGFLDSTIIEDFSKDFIIWGIDGEFEFNHIKKGVKFMPTDHCGCLKILKGEILPTYLLCQLENDRYKYDYDRTLRPSLKNMKTYKVKIPLDKNKKIDIEKQNELIQKYLIIKELKEDLIKLRDELEKIKINLTTKLNFTPFKVENIFDLSITTNRSEFTKDFINKNKGNIPVYSASKDINSIDYGFVKDKLANVKYFEDCLTWNIDGSVEKPHYRKGRFSLSEKVIPLILFEKHKTALNIDYLRFEIEKELAKKKFGFGHKAGKGRIKHIEIMIPTNEDGNFNLEIQNKIANKYNQVFIIRESLSAEIKKLIETGIDFS